MNFKNWLKNEAVPPLPTATVPPLPTPGPAPMPLPPNLPPVPKRAPGGRGTYTYPNQGRPAQGGGTRPRNLPPLPGMKWSDRLVRGFNRFNNPSEEDRDKYGQIKLEPYRPLSSITDFSHLSGKY